LERWRHTTLHNQANRRTKCAYFGTRRVRVVCLHVPSDAPLSKQGPVAKFLFALILPAMVYFFFVFLRRTKSSSQAQAENGWRNRRVIERFLNGTACTHRNGTILLSAVTRTKCWTLSARDVTCLTRVSLPRSSKTPRH